MVSIQFLSQMEEPQQYDTCKHPFILFKTHTISSKANLVITSSKIGWTYLVKTSWKTCVTLQCCWKVLIVERKWNKKNVKRFSFHHKEKQYNKIYCSQPIHSFLLNITLGMCGKNSLVTRSYVKSPHYCCKLIQGNKQGESRNFSEPIQNVYITTKLIVGRKTCRVAELNLHGFYFNIIN